MGNPWASPVGSWPLDEQQPSDSNPFESAPFLLSKTRLTRPVRMTDHWSQDVVWFLSLSCPAVGICSPCCIWMVERFNRLVIFNLTITMCYPSLELSTFRQNNPKLPWAPSDACWWSITYKTAIIHEWWLSVISHIGDLAYNSAVCPLRKQTTGNPGRLSRQHRGAMLNDSHHLPGTVRNFAGAMPIWSSCSLM